ncbi:MAG: hypothetical protein Q9191_004378 [Dirinaria sp. TL-2023a]
MCLGHVWTFPGHCRCIYYAKYPELCDRFKADCRNRGVDYRFEKTLSVVQEPYKYAYCHLKCTLDRGEESLAFVSSSVDPERRPHGLTCDFFDRKPVPAPQHGCPLHGIPPRVPLYGELIEVSWDDVDIIGHRIKDGAIEYYKWKRAGAPRKTWITASEVDADEALTEMANSYHIKTKGPGKSPRETAWPTRDEMSWPVRLSMLLKDPVEISP